jgi:hypothetical protein
MVHTRTLKRTSCSGGSRGGQQQSYSSMKQVGGSKKRNSRRRSNIIKEQQRIQRLTKRGGAWLDREWWKNAGMSIMTVGNDDKKALRYINEIIYRAAELKKMNDGDQGEKFKSATYNAISELVTKANAVKDIFVNKQEVRQATEGDTHAI